MSVKATGKITYVSAVEIDGEVKLHVQGMVKLTKNVFDWMGVVAWQTSWRFFDPYGELLYRDDRWHSIMLMASFDDATDDFTVTLPKKSYYNIQFFGPAIVPLDTKTFRPESPPQPSPPPVIPLPDPEPTPPEPWPILPPEPAPTPPKPSPTPPSPSPVVPAGIGAGVIAIAVIVLLLTMRR